MQYIEKISKRQFMWLRVPWNAYQDVFIKPLLSLRLLLISGRHDKTSDNKIAKSILSKTAENPMTKRPMARTVNL